MNNEVDVTLPSKGFFNSEWLNPKWISAFVAQAIVLVAMLLMLDNRTTVELQSKAEGIVGAVCIVVANLIFIAGVIYHKIHDIPVDDKDDHSGPVLYR